MYVVVLVVFVLLAIGFYILGYIFGKKHYTNQSVGTLRVDQSDEDGPYLFLELDGPVASLICKDYVVFKINLEDYISHK